MARLKFWFTEPKEADFNLKDDYGKTPLSLVDSQRVELTLYLESKGAIRSAEHYASPRVEDQYVTSSAGRVTSQILQLVKSININGAIMLLDILIRKVTGQKFVSTAAQSVSLLEAEAQSYALNITEKFEERIRDEYGIQAGESINLAEMQLEIYQAIRSEDGSKIPDILHLYATEAKPQTCLSNMTVHHLIYELLSTAI